VTDVYDRHGDADEDQRIMAAVGRQVISLVEGTQTSNRASRDEGSGAVGLALHSRPCRSMPATSTNTIRIETHQNTPTTSSS